jgi:Ser-Thr-rich glycosyl-phosphatidyl-inositol-anchored membrane family
MRFFCLVLCLFAALVAAGPNPINWNSDTFTAGQPTTISWQPTTGGTVTLKLQWGSSPTPSSGITIASKYKLLLRAWVGEGQRLVIPPIASKRMCSQLAFLLVENLECWNLVVLLTSCTSVHLELGLFQLDSTIQSGFAARLHY